MFCAQRRRLFWGPNDVFGQKSKPVTGLMHQKRGIGETEELAADVFVPFELFVEYCTQEFERWYFSSRGQLAVQGTNFLSESKVAAVPSMTSALVLRSTYSVSPQVHLQLGLA
jgi:hypothetical protein